ncbi:hypothetical protein [Methanoculleus chikugoensis]|uniref:hypothetical protein n=1 Tax=Methanoculleus chikugoensis TaxID=118126 RepID=UPI000AA49A1B|nr:hypothetical protein [Methanoculleus chikugoensis]
MQLETILNRILRLIGREDRETSGAGPGDACSFIIDPSPGGMMKRGRGRAVGIGGGDQESVPADAGGSDEEGPPLRDRRRDEGV